MVTTNLVSLPMEIVGASSRITVEDDMLHDLLHKQPDPVWMIEPNAAGLWYNEAFYDYTGKTPEYMRNWAWQDFLPAEEIPRVAGAFYQALDKGLKWECVYPLRSRDGRYRQFLVKGAPLHDRKGAVKYWIGSAVDITDYVRVEKLLSQR